MSAFDAAMCVLAADPNFGVLAIYTPAAEASVPVTIRLVPRQPEAAFGGVDAPRSTARSTEVDVPAAALAARPARGDGVSFGGADYQVEEVSADLRATVYTLRLRKVTA